MPEVTVSERKVIHMSQKPPTEEVKEHTQAIAKGVKQELTESRRPWYYLSHAARILLIVYAVQLSLFGLLAFWVHLNPVNPIDVTITREFQENPAAWLKISMEVVSYAGSTFVLPVLVLLAALIFWLGGLRLVLQPQLQGSSGRQKRRLRRKHDLQDTRPQALFPPALVTAGHRRPRSEALGQFTPGRASAHNP